jgi:hypothetical protein
MRNQKLSIIFASREDPSSLAKCKRRGVSPSRRASEITIRTVSNWLLASGRVENGTVQPSVCQEVEGQVDLEN